MVNHRKTIPFGEDVLIEYLFQAPKLSKSLRKNNSRDSCADEKGASERGFLGENGVVVAFFPSKNLPSRMIRPDLEDHFPGRIVSSNHGDHRRHFTWESFPTSKWPKFIAWHQTSKFGMNLRGGWWGKHTDRTIKSEEPVFWLQLLELFCQFFRGDAHWKGQPN